jgi:hypothetical protein
MGIENSPVELNLTGHIDEFFEVHRLYDIGVRAQQIGFMNVDIFGGRRKHYDRNSSKHGMLPYGSQDLQPAYFGQFEI